MAKELIVKITGNTSGDLGLAMEEVARLVAEGYLCGHNGNDTGSFTFDITGEDDAAAEE